MTRIGADVKFHDGACRLADDPRSAIGALAGLGYQGILVRTIDEAFPTLDEREIASFAHTADEHGFFVRMGIGKVNPYMTAELPRVRQLGGGSYRAGMERMIRLCARFGWTEVWTAVGGFKPGLPAPFCFDRFRTDVTWQAQLDSTARFIQVLAPTLRAEGVRLNIETHEEITTHELVRLVESLGPDIAGVCLDPANLPVRGEAVAPAAARVAALTHLTHLRDFVLLPSEHGISRFLAPIGDGCIDWPGLLEALRGRDDVDLIVEGIGGTRAEMLLQPRDPFWVAAHPDLDPSEIAELERVAGTQEELARSGEGPDAARLRTTSEPVADHRDFLARSLAALRALVPADAARSAGAAAR
ncbi:sugar phosphate isomerase/epimerase family protein [Microbacterium sp. B2969]|uniref:Sugar phosphate isomerase/epimerase family protein n=1 Tax=Microbacterium alkaliflavum TaxID=3248839 RepID=A0ABW7Q6Y2_9MICO